jgi:hypothetical protein
MSKKLDNQIPTRIAAFMQYLGLTAYAFEKECQIGKSVLQISIKNNTSVGSDKLEQILATYPQLSPVWLMTGHGSMLLDQEYIPQISDNQTNTSTLINNVSFQTNEADLVQKTEQQANTIVQQERELSLLREMMADKNEIISLLKKLSTMR